MRAGILLLMLAAVPLPALADLSGTYVKPGASFTMLVEVAANGDVRGDSGRPGQSFITHAGRGYFIRKEPSRTVVMSVENMGTVLSEQMAKLDPSFRDEMQKHATTIKLVEKGTMTVDGRTGAAFFMQAADGRLSPVPWVVISSDPALAPLGVAMSRQFEMSLATMSSTMGTAPFANMLAVLRKGTPILIAGAELHSVSNSPIPASHFELPAKPEALDAVRQSMTPSTPRS